jgi:hypothetical protein
LQWGITVMISLQTALFFVRKDILAWYINSKQLSPGSELPLNRYLIGTGFLAFMALVLSKFTARANEQYRNYKKQLIQCRKAGSGIEDLPIRYTGRWAYALYLAFPVIDLIVRRIVSISIKFPR